MVCFKTCPLCIGYDKKRIEIVFSFDDVLMKAIEKYQKGVKEA